MKNLLLAADFAAKRHSKQKRKNAEGSPYINHPLEVAAHLTVVGGVVDEEILVAALLHDTVEDTSTTSEEIASRFGERVAKLVMECTDDTNLAKAEQKRLQIVHAPSLSPAAKMIKIADKTSNLRAILDDPPAGWPVQRQRDYFLWAEQVVAGLLGVNPALDEQVREVLRQGFQKMGRAG